MDTTNRRHVEKYAARLARREGFVLRPRRTPTGNVDIDRVVEAFGVYASVNTDSLHEVKSNRFVGFHHTMNLFAPVQFDAEKLFWTVEHEFGHILQWREYGASTMEALLRDNRYSVEADAWDRAMDHAEDMGIIMTDRMAWFRDTCLLTYVKGEE